MTNTVYFCGADNLLSGDDFLKHNYGVAVMDKSYVVDAGNHCYVEDIADHIVGRGELDCFTVDNERVFAKNTTVTANTNCATPCANFDNACSLVIFKDLCVDSRSQLLINISENIFGLPIQFSGPELMIEWDKKGVMGTSPCSPGLSGISSHTPNSPALPVDPNDEDALNNFLIWVGNHKVSSIPIDVKLTTPTFDNQGNVSCSYAKAYLAEINKAELALMQKRYVAWDGRAISFSSIGDIRSLKREWEHRVQQACNSCSGGGRKPMMFGNIC